MPVLLRSPLKPGMSRIAALILAGFLCNTHLLARTNTTGAASHTSRVTVSGDTLWKIAGNLGADRDQSSPSRQQFMYAILRKNPEAFVGGNIYFLKRGVALVAPNLDEVRAENAAEVARHFKEHEANWLNRKRAAPPLYPLAASAPLTSEVPALSPPPQPMRPPPVVEPAATTQPAAPSPALAAPATVVPAPAVEPSKPVEAALPKTADEPAKPVSPAHVPESDATIPTVYIAILIFAFGFGLWWFFSRRRGYAAPIAKVPPADLNKVLPKVAPVGLMVVAELAEPPVSAPDHQEAAIKLLIGEAYLELGRNAEARAIVQEAAQEGNTTTRAAAATVMGKILASAPVGAG